MSEIPLNNHITIDISTALGGIRRTGYKVPLILTSESGYSGATRIMSFSSIDEVEEEWATSTDAYKMAQKMFAQSPRPSVVKIAIEETRVAEVQTLTFSADIITGNTVAMTVDGVSISEPFDTNHLTTMEAIADAIEAVSSVSTATVGGASNRVITITAQNAGVPVSISGITVTGGASQATVTKAITTENHGFVEDLNEIIDIDNDFYFIVWNETGLAYTKYASTQLESYKKIAVFDQDDADLLVISDTTNLGYHIKNSSLTRAFLVYQSDLTQYVSSAAVGRYSVYNVGKTTMLNKQLASVTPESSLTSSDRAALSNFYAMHVGSTAGVSYIFEPIRIDGNYLDHRQTIDYIHSFLQEELFAWLYQISNLGEKVPYTQAGLDMFENKLRSLLKYLESENIINFEGINFEDQVTIPKIGDILSSDKASRTLNNVEFQAKVNGAIYKFNITGQLTA